MAAYRPPIPPLGCPFSFFLFLQPKGGSGRAQFRARELVVKERKKTDKLREGWEDGTPPPHRDFKETSHPSLGLSVLFLSFFTLARGWRKEFANAVAQHEKEKMFYNKSLSHHDTNKRILRGSKELGELVCTLALLVY